MPKWSGSLKCSLWKWENNPPPRKLHCNTPTPWRYILFFLVYKYEPNNKCDKTALPTLYLYRNRENVLFLPVKKYDRVQFSFHYLQLFSMEKRTHKANKKLKTLRLKKTRISIFWFFIYVSADNLQRNKCLKNGLTLIWILYMHNVFAYILIDKIKLNYIQ